MPMWTRDKGIRWASSFSTIPLSNVGLSQPSGEWVCSQSSRSTRGKRMPEAIQAVCDNLPHDFPDALRHPIVGGIEQTLRRMENAES